MSATIHLATRCDSDMRVADRSINTLTGADIEALSGGDVLALRLSRFYAPEHCAMVRARVTGATKTHYEVAPSVTKIGMALFEATDAALLEAYYADAERAGQRARALYGELDDPIDRLQTMLARIWPAGCEVERLHDRAMYAGLVRVIDSSSELRPHQDNTDWDMRSSARAQTMRTQLSANVYFSAADEGGDLELWPAAIGDEAHYRSLQVPGDYALARAAIGEPAVTIRPAAGDLLIFDARRIHAVTRVTRGSRTNASTFIGLRDARTPLTLFS